MHDQFVYTQVPPSLLAVYDHPESNPEDELDLDEDDEGDFDGNNYDDRLTAPDDEHEYDTYAWLQSNRDYRYVAYFYIIARCSHCT